MSETDPELLGRLERLEAAVAHLERAYDQLNAVVTGHSRRLDRVERQLERVGDAMMTAQLDEIRARNAPPPHSAPR